MNKQIEDFSDQCWEYRKCSCRKYSPPWFDYKKFAELIVLECAKISEEYAYSETLPMLISYHIKQHFGVE